MQKFLIVFILLTCATFLDAQVIYISDEQSKLYTLNISNCNYSFITNINIQVTDISFNPDGNLYGVTSDGHLIEINITNGSTNIVHTFEGADLNSLTIAGTGIAYASGGDGKLWSYDLLTGEEVLYGNLGFPATGDLTFYKGDLYAAITDDRILKIDLEMVSNSTIVIQQNVIGDVFGIVSFADECSDIKTYALTNTTNMYQINFESSSMEFICGLDIVVYGGASTFEFLASSFISLEVIEETIPACGMSDGSIIVEAAGGTGELLYSIDGINFQSDGIFNNLPEGNYTVVVSDEDDCSNSYTTDLSSKNLIPFVDITSNNAACESEDGSIVIALKSDTINLEFSLNGSNSQSDLLFDNLPPGTFDLVLTDDEGCRSETAITIIQGRCPVFVPNAFSPDFDGVNDIFTLYTTSSFSGEIKTFRVFNRWGALMYEALNTPLETIGWNGIFKGKSVGPGVYVYYIEVIHGDGSTELIKGDVTLVR